MIPLDIYIDVDQTGRWKDVDPASWHGDDGTRISVATIRHGTASGQPAVLIRFDLPDGRTFIAQTTGRLFLAAARAVESAHEGEL